MATSVRRYLAEEHPELFEGMRYALGEFGGFTLHVGGKRFYPIQVAEKQICWLKATIRGRGGHGAIVNRGGTVARLGKLLRDLDRKRTAGACDSRRPRVRRGDRSCVAASRGGWSCARC